MLQKNLKTARSSRFVGGVEPPTPPANAYATVLKYTSNDEQWISYEVS